MPSNSILNIKKDGAWVEVPAIKGEDGVTPNLTIGTVETLPSSTEATASITGDKENPVLNLGIPKGANGTDGNDGAAGADGYTPVRGTDYWTANDIAEIHSYIDNQIGGALNESY